jgi:S-adenosylmethionine decarboxylase
MIVGTGWRVDAAGCREDALRDVEQLRAIFARVIAELELQVVGEAAWHKFPPPGGVTGMAMLTESHLACHTYPEFGVATFNLYCCRTRPTWPWAERLREMLGAREVRVQVVERRAPVAENAVFELPLSVTHEGQV